MALGTIAPALAAPTPAELQRGLTFYLPLEGDAAPRHVTGARIVKGEGLRFVGGKAGRAAAVRDGGIEVPGAGNFSRPRGSLAFWVRPDWMPDDRDYTGDRRFFGTDNFTLNYHRPKQVFFFMTGKTKPGEGYRWDYGTADHEQVSRWKPGEWHHVAATWDAATGGKALYLDGRPVSRHTTEWLRSDPFREKGSVTLGDKHAPGAYDELMLWDRVLSPEEVALLAAEPAAVARTLNEKLPRPQAQKRWPVEFSLYALSAEEAPATIVEPGREFAAKIPAENTGGTPWRGRVTFTLLDFWGKPRGTREMDLTLRPGEKRTLAVPFIAPERGVFKVAVRLQDGGATWERDVASFAAWPKPAGPPDPDSFFGHHVNSWSEGVVAQAARLGIGWNRNHNMLQFTWWPRVQPEPGPLTWTYDFQHERMREHGMRVLGQFFGTPYWAAAGGKSLPPQKPGDYPRGARPDAGAFRRYVYETVKRYPDVRHWEVWNEPDVSMFWGGSPEEFAELCRAAHEEAKRADPAVVVMNGGYTQPAWPWHEKAARAGALRYADAVSFHGYYDATRHPEELHEQFAGTAAHFRKLAREHGGRELPLWDTEGGSSDTTWLRGFESPDLPPPDVRTPLNWRTAAIAAVQSAAILQSLGVVRSFQYLWQPSRPGNYEDLTALDMTNAPKPRLMARVALAAQVDGARHAGEVRRPEGRLWAHAYQKKGGSVVLLWAGRGGRVRVDAAWPGNIGRRADIMGNERPAPTVLEVSEEPSYLHAAAPAEAALKALRDAKVTVLAEPIALPQKAAEGEKAGRK